MRGCVDTRFCKLFLSLVVECKTAKNNTVYLTSFNVFAHFIPQTFSDCTFVPTKQFFSSKSLLIVEIKKYIIVAKQFSSQRAVLVQTTHQQSVFFSKIIPYLSELGDKSLYFHCLGKLSLSIAMSVCVCPFVCLYPLCNFNMEWDVNFWLKRVILKLIN